MRLTACRNQCRYNIEIAFGSLLLSLGSCFCVFTRFGTPHLIWGINGLHCQLLGKGLLEKPIHMCLDPEDSNSVPLYF
jgi:hypothetical protein